MEDEEEPPKTPAASKSKRRKETGVQSHDKVPQVVGRHLLVSSQALSFWSISGAAVARGLWARGHAGRWSGQAAFVGEPRTAAPVGGSFPGAP